MNTSQFNFVVFYFKCKCKVAYRSETRMKNLKRNEDDTSAWFVARLNF